jgi:hypothetical protein
MLTTGSAWTSVRLLLVTGALLGLLGGCGGGGGGGSTASAGTGGTGATGGTGGTGTPPPPPAAAEELLVSSPNLPSSGASTVDVTAVVLDANSRTITGKTVTLSVTDVAPKAFLSDISSSGVTDANGKVIAKLNLGTNKGNRTITLTATADGITATNSVNVIGTTVNISGNSSLVFGNATPLTITAKDSVGNGISNAPITVTSAAGNTLTPASGTTDATGQFTTTVTGTKAGSDTITASGIGVTKTFALTVSAANFGFTAPASGTELPVGKPATLTVHWDQSGVPVAGAAVSFSATRGALTGSPATTNSAGNATVTISSTSAGPATITAAGPGGTPVNSVNVTFVATSVSRVDVQANPSTVPVNLVGSSANTSTITAVVRDAADNLVKNARVNFSITNDPSGGSLTSPSAITDASGVAAVTYVAGTVTCCGPNPSGNAIVITATVTDLGGVPVTGVSNQTTLTVGGQPLFVRLGTDNTLASAGLNYQKRYSALVTDAAGNPVPGATVQFTVRPAQATSDPPFAYFKGVRVFCILNNPPPTPPAPPPINPLVCGALVSLSQWLPIVSASCLNEDTNFNGILDPGEDTNNDGQLTPGNVASVNTVAATDSNGSALATITYAKQFADWTVVTLTARASVSGTEGTSSTTFTLPVAFGDVTSASLLPPGVVSPFGQSSDCTTETPK